MKKKTHKEYVSELAIKNPNVICIGEYSGANIKIQHHCLIHDIDFDIKPANALKGDGCNKCHRERISASNGITREQYIDKVRKVNPNIMLKGEYKNNVTPTLHKCLIHNIEWMAYPNNILRGNGCSECRSEKISDTNKKDHITYVNELKFKNKDIVVLEQYINARTPILHMCKIHNVKWNASPDSILSGCGCPQCRGDKISENVRKTHDEYVAKLKLVNPEIEVVGTYIDYITPILHRCLIDGNEWYGVPSYILAGTGCPKCNESKGEREVRMWLEQHNISFEQQKRYADCCDKRTLPFDFYLPDYNAVIEYNGLQHYYATDYFGGKEALKYIQNHDRIKEEYCKNNDIKYLCIPYTKDVDTELNNFLFI